MSVPLSLFLLTILWKDERDCKSGLFWIANLLEVDRNKLFYDFKDFNSLKTKMK